MDFAPEGIHVGQRLCLFDIGALCKAVTAHGARQINAWQTHQQNRPPHIDAGGIRWQLALATEDATVWYDALHGEYILVERLPQRGHQVWSVSFNAGRRPATPAEHNVETARAYYLLMRLGAGLEAEG